MMTSKRIPWAFMVVAGLGSAAHADQAIFGKKFHLVETAGGASSRKLTMRGREVPSDDTLTGDPQAGGATVRIAIDGATPSSVTINLPGGSRWLRFPSNSSLPATHWRYRESAATGYVTPIRDLDLAITPSGASIKLRASGAVFPLALALPNPGTGASIAVDLAGGDTYCVAFGGTAGGPVTANTAFKFTIGTPTTTGTCPAPPPPDPICGNGVVEGSEQCDGTACGSVADGCYPAGHASECTCCSSVLCIVGGGPSGGCCPGLSCVPTGGAGGTGTCTSASCVGAGQVCGPGGLPCCPGLSLLCVEPPAFPGHPFDFCMVGPGGPCTSSTQCYVGSCVAGVCS